MTRGDIVTIATRGGFGGKPRPALVIQSSAFADLTTVIVIPFTTALVNHPNPLRIRVEPDATNGLKQPSELMIHIPVSVRHEEVGRNVGRLSNEDLTRAEQALMLVLGFAE